MLRAHRSRPLQLISHNEDKLTTKPRSTPEACLQRLRFLLLATVSGRPEEARVPCALSLSANVADGQLAESRDAWSLRMRASGWTLCIK